MNIPRVFAKVKQFRDRNTVVPENFHNSELSLHSVGSRQQFAGRFFPQNILLVAKLYEVGWIGLAVLELSQYHGTVWKFQLSCEVGLEAVLVNLHSFSYPRGSRCDPEVNAQQILELDQGRGNITDFDGGDTELISSLQIVAEIIKKDSLVSFDSELIQGVGVDVRFWLPLPDQTALHHMIKVVQVLENQPPRALCLPVVGEDGQLESLLLEPGDGLHHVRVRPVEAPREGLHEVLHHLRGDARGGDLLTEGLVELLQGELPPLQPGPGARVPATSDGIPYGLFVRTVR